MKKKHLKKLAVLGCAVSLAGIGTVANAAEINEESVKVASEQEVVITRNSNSTNSLITDRGLSGSELVDVINSNNYYSMNVGESETAFLQRIPTKMNVKTTAEIQKAIDYLTSSELKAILDENGTGTVSVEYNWQFVVWYQQATDSDVDTVSVVKMKVVYDASGKLSTFSIVSDMISNTGSFSNGNNIILDIWEDESGSLNVNGTAFDYESDWYDLVTEHSKYDDSLDVQAAFLNFEPASDYSGNDIQVIKSGSVVSTEKFSDEGTLTTVFENVFNKTVKLAAELNNPTITGPTSPFIVNVDNPLTLEQITSQLVATDPTEGDITDNIQITNNSYILVNGKIAPGQYGFTATVSDTSGNSTSKNFIIIVSDAVNPTISGSNMSTGNSTKLTSAQIKDQFTYSDNNDTNMDFEIIEDNYSANWNKPGSYTVTARVTDDSDNSAEATITITVEDTTDPTISGRDLETGNDVKLTDAELKALFTISDDVTATGNLTLTIITNEYSSNWNKPGSYDVTCRVTDAAGNTAEATITITVEDVVDPTISGEDITFGNNLQKTDADLKALFTVSDDVTSTNNLTKSLILNEYSSNWNKPGTYDVTCRVTDAAGNTAEATITITVKDVVKPTISGTNKTVTNERELTQSELKALFTISDDITATADLTLTITANSYTANYATPGTYNVTARVTDAAGNYADATITITVTDGIAPTITATNKTTGNDKQLTTAEIEALFTYSDDSSSIDDDLVFTYDADSYLTNYKKPGTYNVVGTVTDAYGNTSTATAVITVKDTTKPTISGANKQTGNSNCLTTSELKALFTISDDVTATSDLTLQITTDEYTDNYAKPGTYEVTARVTDAAGNYAEATITVTVKDTTKPTIKATNKTTGNSAKLTVDEIKALFTISDDVTATSALTLTINSTDYTDNYATPGTYTVTGTVKDAAGNTSTATATITVTDTTKPTIKATNTTVSYTKKLSEAELKALFTISDDVTATSALTLTITKDNYSSVYTSLGSYTVTAKVTDAAGNYSEATATITVKDDVKPIISVPQNLKITTLDGLTESDIRGHITVTDAKSGTITNYTLTDTNGYFDNTKEPGTYSFTVTASDGAGNSTSVTFTMEVVDEDKPTIDWAPNCPYVIVLAEGDTLTKDMILNILTQSGQLENVAVTSLESNYFENNETVGVYSLRVRGINTQTQEAIEVVSLINVVSDQDVEVEPDLEANEGNTSTDDGSLDNEKDNQASEDDYWTNFKHLSKWTWKHWTLVISGIGLILLAIIWWKKRH